MRLLSALLAMLAFASCASVPSQRWPHIDATYYCDAPFCPSPERTEEATIDFVMMWSEVFRPCDPTGVDLTWTSYIDPNVLGRYVQAFNTIELLPSRRRPDGIADTALGHELVHMCLGQGYGDTDHDHAEGSGPWDVRVEIFLAVFDDLMRKRESTDL